MNVAKTLALLLAPAAFVDALCTVDFPRPWNDTDTPVTNQWPPVNLTQLPDFLMGLNGSHYGLWSAFVGSLLTCPDLPSLLNATEIANAKADITGAAFVCFYDSSPSCPSYRANAGCAREPFYLPGEFCFRVSQCTDLYTPLAGGAISAKWNAGTGSSRQIDVHRGYGCPEGAQIIRGNASAEGVCQKFPMQNFYIKTYTGEGRTFQSYAANWAQFTAHVAICDGAYNQTCLGTTGQGVAFATAFGASLSANPLVCPDLSRPFPPTTGPNTTGSGTSSASTIVASVALIGVGAFLF